MSQKLVFDERLDQFTCNPIPSHRLPGVVVLVEGAVREVEGPGPALVDVRATVVVFGAAVDKNITDSSVRTGLFQQTLACVRLTRRHRPIACTGTALTRITTAALQSEQDYSQMTLLRRRNTAIALKISVLKLWIAKVHQHKDTQQCYLKKISMHLVCTGDTLLRAKVDFYPTQPRKCVYLVFIASSSRVCSINMPLCSLNWRNKRQRK